MNVRIVDLPAGQDPNSYFVGGASAAEFDAACAMPAAHEHSKRCSREQQMRIIIPPLPVPALTELHELIRENPAEDIEENRQKENLLFLALGSYFTPEFRLTERQWCARCQNDAKICRSRSHQCLNRCVQLCVSEVMDILKNQPQFSPEEVWNSSIKSSASSGLASLPRYH